MFVNLPDILLLLLAFGLMFEKGWNFLLSIFIGVVIFVVGRLLVYIEEKWWKPNVYEKFFKNIK